MKTEILNEEVIEFEFLDYSLLYNHEEDAWYIWYYDENFTEQEILVTSAEEIKNITGEEIKFESLKEKVRKLFNKGDKNENSERS